MNGTTYHDNHSGQVGGVAYGFNPAGLRLTRTQTNAGQPAEIESYTYDPAGNRTHATEGGSGIAYTANPVNQYTLAGQEPLAYDRNGNLIQMGSRWNASYDGANRLVQAQAQGNSMTVAYDAFHRPVTRTVNGQTRHMVWDGWQLAEERAADNALVARYVHGQGSDEIISRTDAQGATLYYHHDGLGNTLALTDTTGQVVERYSYDAFGTAHIFDATFNPLPASLQNNRFLFTGREWIAELNLYDYRNRAYSAELGRFLQTDPIRFKAGDLNLYRYCGNEPVNHIDRWGLEITNNTDCNIFVQPEHGSQMHTLKPHEKYPEEVDAVTIPNKNGTQDVYKITDPFNNADIDVNKSGLDFPGPDALMDWLNQAFGGGPVSHPPNPSWNDIFQKANQQNGHE